MPKGDGSLSLTIVMPTFNRLDQTIACATAAMSAVREDENASLVVIDNGSTDGTWEALFQRLGTTATVVSAPGVTISELRNIGASKSSADIVCFVDSDCVVPQKYLQRIRDVMLETGADAVGAMYALPDDVH